MTTKAELHQLLDELPDDINEAIAAYLARMRDPLERALELAPIDDEPLTPEEEAAIDEGMAAYRRGDFITSKEAKRRLLP